MMKQIKKYLKLKYQITLWVYDMSPPPHILQILNNKNGLEQPIPYTFGRQNKMFRKITLDPGRYVISRTVQRLEFFGRIYLRTSYRSVFSVSKKGRITFTSENWTRMFKWEKL